MSEFPLAAGFPAVKESDWQALVERILDGRPVERVASHSRDGVRLGPMFGQRHEGRQAGRVAAPWRIFQRVDHPDLEAANELAKLDLEGGADGLEIVFPGSCGANGFGVGVDRLDDLDRLLDGIDIEQVPLRLDGGYEIRQLVALMLALIDRRGIDPAKLDILALSDPANGLFADGRLIARHEHVVAWGADLAHAILQRDVRLPFLVADARSVHAGGGSEAQELAYALADGLEHLRGLERHGIAPEIGVSFLSFSFAADADQFLTMAKLRAFRLLWARIADVAGLPAGPVRVHAETAWRMMTRRDPWTNILRGAIAVAGAGLGGADSVTVLPFTGAVGLPDAFARRVAGNTQLVLLHESGLADVADPAAGSGYVESVTADLAEAAWELFREIEGEGGIVAALLKGTFQAKVLEIHRAWIADIASRREALVGVSEFALLDERPVTTLQAEPAVVQEAGCVIELPAAGEGEHAEAIVAAFAEGATLADLLATFSSDWQRVRKVEKIRLAEPFERLRDASDAERFATGKWPRVFLANIGGPAEFSARATWAHNVFAAGGIEAVAGDGGTDVAAIAGEFAGSGAKIACICSTDDLYAEHACALAATLGENGARLVYLAGRPGKSQDGLREAGVGGFIYSGCDILQELERCHRELDLPRTGGTRDTGLAT